MACVEHLCMYCEYSTDNNSAEPTVCPSCGARMIASYDEDYTEDYDDEETEQTELQSTS
jgi:hypothetical protein